MWNNLENSKEFHEVRNEDREYFSSKTISQVSQIENITYTSNN